MNQRQKEKLIAQAMGELTSAKQLDTETAHRAADDILCWLLLKLGARRVVRAYDQIPKWYA